MTSTFLLEKISMSEENSLSSKAYYPDGGLALKLLFSHWGKIEGRATEWSLMNTTAGMT